jgi:DNA polymerase-1
LKDWRQAAKSINFKVIFEGTDESLAEEMQVSLQEAKDFRDKYFGALKPWKERTINEIMTKNEIVTPYGRVRRFPFITRDVFDDVRREGINMIVQSTASDICLNALTRIVNRQDPMRYEVVATVHDCIVASASDVGIDDTMALIKDEMETPPFWTDFSFKVDICKSDRWEVQGYDYGTNPFLLHSSRYNTTYSYCYI